MRELPPQFVSRTRQLGLDGCDRLLEALAQSDPSVSVRPSGSRPWLPPGAGTPVPWLPGAHYLDSRPQFTSMPALHQGRFYVQDASSMFIAEVLRQIAGDGPVAMLDACAAPGGKTTAAVDALPEGSIVVANEYDSRRAAVLRENVVKWGSPSTVVTRGDTSRLRALPGAFDIIAVDAPCSGEGMFRKDAEAVAQWSEGLVRECAARQREIIDNAWQALKPGGYMIYSTCTFNRDENESNVEWLLSGRDAEAVEIAADESWNIVRTPLAGTAATACRFLPGIVRGEGLFMAVVRKGGTVASAKKTPKPLRGRGRANNSDIGETARWLESPDSFDIRREGDTIVAVPSVHAGLTDMLAKKLDVIYRGVPLATVKGRDLVPAHALAMSTALLRGAFHEVELDLQTSLAYLRCEAVALPGGTPRGFVVVTHGGCPLGFMKNIGSRANNLYPREWRILKQF